VHKNQLILLYALVALATVCRLGGVSIEQIAYAQIWDFNSNIHNQSVDNNLPIKGTGFKSNKISISSNNCMSVASGPGGNTAISGSAGRSVAISPGASNHVTVSSSSSSKTTSNCDTQDIANRCPKLNVSLLSKSDAVPFADVVEYQNIIRATSEPGAPPPAGLETDTSNTISVQEICGTQNDDYIIGSQGDDIIFGLASNDVITALGGDDLVFGGRGDDVVYGGPGNNQLFGSDGNDNLVGGTEDDLIVGGPGSDRLYGNSGDDILQGQQGADYFDCGDGLDTVIDYNPSQGDVITSNCDNVNQVH
jgi:Ca2+-binding RTX toxin-like protein